MHLQHQLPSKVYYLDRLGNMSTSSSSFMSTNSISGSTTSLSASSAGSAPIGTAVRKQILPLKPKHPMGHVQHLEMKGKPQEMPMVPVTMLELKKKEKNEKNVVTNLIYRKPSTISSSGSGSGSSDHLHHHHHHHHHLPMMAPPRRPGSPSSSGYETDSLVDQENCDVFSNMLNPFAYNHHEMDMLHAHPIWSPQAADNSVSSLSSNNNNNNNNLMSAINHNHHHNHRVYGYSDDQFLVQ